MWYTWKLKYKGGRDEWINGLRWVAMFLCFRWSDSIILLNWLSKVKGDYTFTHAL